MCGGLLHPGHLEAHVMLHQQFLSQCIYFWMLFHHSCTLYCRAHSHQGLHTGGKQGALDAAFCLCHIPFD